MGKIIFKNKAGQSAVEFLILLPVLVYVLVVAFQMFSITYTSMIDQAATRFEVFRNINNNRGRGEKMSMTGIATGLIPIHPALEAFSPSYRAENNMGNVSNPMRPTRAYYAMKVEEPRGSGKFPRRTITTMGTKVVEVRTRFGVCERSEGTVCGGN